MYQEHLDVGMDAIQQVTPLLLKYFSQYQTLDITKKHVADKTSKHENSPVTQADLEAERLIKRVISEVYPTHSFLGEEGGHTQTKSPYTWIIDPIDGTRDFVRGMDNWSILLALQYNDMCVLGISCMPIKQETISAIQGEGAYCNGKRIHVSDRKLKDAYLCHERYKYFARDGLTQPLLDVREQADYYRSDRTFCFHEVAKGNVEGMMGASTPIYDIAPYIPIIQEAGGKVTTLDGEPIRGTPTTYLMTNGYIHDDITHIFAPYITNK